MTGSDAIGEIQGRYRGDIGGRYRGDIGVEVADLHKLVKALEMRP